MARPTEPIAFNDLNAQRLRIKDELRNSMDAVLEHGKFIMGPEVQELESKLAAFSGAAHALGCANGTDALHLVMMALGIQSGDAVFVPAFTFAATAEVVPIMGATPFFVDIDHDTYNISVDSLRRSIAEAKNHGLTPKTVIPVDLFGLPADYDAISEVARAEGMSIISDSAQGFGATYKGKRSGAIADVTTISFFPAKPLGCYGDGGAVITNDQSIADIISSCRFHGKGSHKYDNERLGLNSRLDTLQAAILLTKLSIYPDEIEARQEVARRYTEGLSQYVSTPTIPRESESVWAQYTIRIPKGKDRSQIQSDLKEVGIPTAVYYPMPLHQQTAYKSFPSDPNGLPESSEAASSVLSLPMHPYLDANAQDYIIEQLKSVVVS